MTHDECGRAEAAPVGQPVVASVQQGETIEITDRGRPVALLAPLPHRGPLDRLRVSGQLDESDGDLIELPEPMVLPPGTEPPGAVLARLRRSER